MTTKSLMAIRLVAGSSLLLLLGLLFARFSSNVPSGVATAGNRSDKINLAIRRTADRLLRAAGDSTSRIPAVQQPNPQTFRVALGHTFDYDRLPALLQQSLAVHQISDTYDVAVLDCATGELLLGYSAADLFGKDAKGVACSGRSKSAGCYMLQVIFASASSGEKQPPVWPLLAVGSLLVGVLFVGWRWSGQVRSQAEPPAVELPLSASTPQPTSDQLYFGMSRLDVANLTLIAGEERHTLTYREAKLLRLLANHPNQVLERDQILKLVWEDEGITVGRSLDVFISRLRKLLATDSTLKIAAVHGVGYRLEVHELANS
ncbi:winged helix-turn-helix domain-containing protein [Fibrella sp. ES10-3-2-2]